MKKIRVNISTPNNWGFDTFLRLHSPEQSRMWGDFSFYHNQTSGSFDYWVILDQLEEDTSLKVTKGNIFFVTMEEAEVVSGYLEQYLSQFDHVITSRKDIRHHELIKSHYFTKWHINKSYDELKASLSSNLDKTKALSAIISGKVHYGQHKKRFSLINKLKGHFKDDLDWFSKDENPIEDKWSGLAQYKYSIAIENSSYPQYFTEKIVDVILCEAAPIYWGAPDICDFFPSELIVQIPLDDYKKSIDIIEDSISSDKYSDLLPLIKDAKSKILDEYQFLPWLTQILEQNASPSNSQIQKKLYLERNVLLKSRIRNKIKAIIGK